MYGQCIDWSRRAIEGEDHSINQTRRVRKGPGAEQALNGLVLGWFERKKERIMQLGAPFVLTHQPWMPARRAANGAGLCASAVDSWTASAAAAW